VPVGERYIQAATRSVSLEASVVDRADDVDGDFGNLAASLSILGDPVRVDGESRKGRLHRKGGEGRWESWW
jgi:hypothetical protein